VLKIQFSLGQPQFQCHEVYKLPLTSQLSLSAIMNRAGTDKLWGHHYEGEYERHFSPLRNSPIKLLEIGIGGYAKKDCGGHSIRAWRDYFSQGLIFGLDIEDKSLFDSDRIKTLVGDQSDKDKLAEINAEYGPFDIIIDDGSHIQSHILTSFDVLFSLLKPGGIYVIEDLRTSYWPESEGSDDPFKAEKPNSMTLIRDLIDGLHWKFWKNRKPTMIQMNVQSVHASDEIVFIYKTSKTEIVPSYRLAYMAS
jgi:demethylmacrocin O-methyltransferase